MYRGGGLFFIGDVLEWKVRKEIGFWEMLR